MSTKILEQTLKTWCDKNLTGTWPGHFYKGKPYTLDGEEDTRNGTLVYTDGSSCSAGYVDHDVYILEDGTYQIYTSGSQARFQGDGKGEKIEISSTHCNSIVDVVKFISEHGFYDPNGCEKLINMDILNYPPDEYNGELTDYEKEALSHRCKKRKPPFDISKCTDNDKYIIESIKKSNNVWMDDWWNKGNN